MKFMKKNDKCHPKSKQKRKEKNIKSSRLYARYMNRNYKNRSNKTQVPFENITQRYWNVDLNLIKKMSK